MSEPEQTPVSIRRGSDDDDCDMNDVKEKVHDEKSDIDKDLEKPKNAIDRDDSLHYMDAMEDHKEEEEKQEEGEQGDRGASAAASSSLCVMEVTGITIKPKQNASVDPSASSDNDSNNENEDGKKSLPDPPSSNNNEDIGDDEKYKNNKTLSQIESLYGLTLRPKINMGQDGLMLGAVVQNISSSSENNKIRINDEIAAVNGTSITTTTSNSEEWNPTPFDDIIALIQKVMDQKEEKDRILVLDVARVLGIVSNDRPIEEDGDDERVVVGANVVGAAAPPTLDDLAEAGLATDPEQQQEQQPSAPTLEDLDEAGFTTTPPPPPAPQAEQTQTQEEEKQDAKPGTAECGLCYETISILEASHCSNTDTPHYLCNDCFCSYATAELQPTGSYEAHRAMTISTQTSNNENDEAEEKEEEEFTSEPGQLPCYLFLAGSCTCTSIPPTTIARVLSTNAAVLDLYEQARRRKIEADVTRSRKAEEEAQRKFAQNAKPIELLKIDIQDALVRGCHVSCPNCDVHVQKDDACMHMTCSCGTVYCYCCGNERDGENEYDEEKHNIDSNKEEEGEESKMTCPRFGCDIPSPFLEDHPLWGGYALVGENAGTGALHEFHRQRQVYFLRNVKRSHSREVWEELAAAEPELLRNVPTVGRNISWDYDGEIEDAAVPVFGNTRLSKIRWLEKEVQPKEEPETEEGEGTTAVETTCGICMEPTTNANFCVGASPHGLCDECFCGYAGAQFEPTGAFEGERRREGGDDNNNEEEKEGNESLVSERGHLPCYLFLTGECDCTSIPATTLARVLSTDERVLELYDQARRRIIAADEERNRQEAARAQEESEARESPVDKLRRVVGEALSRGGHTRCPDCDLQAQKNDACMHMECPCGTRYCYCCGRRSGNAQGECPRNGGGCDSQTPFLESYPGWSAFDINGETPGMGALHEFHRLRMAYFLRQVKESCSAEDWAALRRESPEILQDVPTPGRRIRWDEIDNAEPPLFGSTQANELRWANDGARAQQAVDGEDEDRRNNNNGNEVDESILRDGPQDPYDKILHYFDDNRLLWFWAACCAVTLALLAARAGNNGRGLRVAGALGISFLATTGLPILMVRAIDKGWQTPRSWVRSFREVQCCGHRDGINNQMPYLATGGRWHQYRMIYWVIFVGFISFGTVSMSYAGGNSSAEAFGGLLLVWVFMYYASLTFVVNKAPLPPQGREPNRSEYLQALKRLRIYLFFFSLGAGLMIGYEGDYNSGNQAGKSFIALSTAAALAEIVPRLLIAYYTNQENPLSRTPHKLRVMLGYFFFVGIAAGSLMVGLTDESNGGLNGFGIFVLVMIISVSIGLYYWRVKDRPLVA